MTDAAGGADGIVVAIGDDQTDEECYSMLPEGSVTVHVNGGTTNADYRVSDPADVRRILRAIAYRPTRAPAAVPALPPMLRAESLT
jgi:trehalose-6-phosphatase